MSIKKFQIERFEKAIKTSTNIHQVLVTLGIKPYGGNYLSIKKQAKLYNISIDHLLHDRINKNSIDVPVELLLNACKTNKSKSGTLKAVGLSPTSGSNIRWITKKIKELSIDTTHWLKSGWNKGQSEPGKYSNIEDILSTKKSITSHKLKLILINKGILKKECNECHISMWLDKPLSLHLHHIDGNHLNNALDNLKLLCPNCHSQTHTYCRKKETLNLQPISEEEKQHASKPRRSRKQWQCNVCGKNIKKKANMCKSCFNKNRKLKVNIGINELFQLLKDNNFNYTRTGKIIGISDNAIRKRLSRNGIDLKAIKSLK